MARVLVSGIDRPGLADWLSRRGMAVAAGDGAATLALVACPGLAPALPRIVEAADGARAAALLDAGIDDVVIATDPDQVVAARLAALARRVAGPAIIVGDIAIDPLARTVRRGGRPVAVLPREYALLLVLARAAGATLSAETLRRAVSGSACAPGTNVVAVHLSRLRTRLGEGTARIVTERGRGYRLVAAAWEDGRWTDG